MTNLGECIVTLTADQGGATPDARCRGQVTQNAAGKTTPVWIDLIPAGAFSGRDGRGPYRNEHPELVIAETGKLGMTAGLPVDFDHAIDLGAPRGQPAPAAGWIRELRLVDGVIQGRVEWTAAGAKALAAKLYRYISPVFEFSGDGTVQRLLRAAMTNNPNLYLTAIASAESGTAPRAHEDFHRTIRLIRESLAVPTPAILRAMHGCLRRATGQAAARFLTAGDFELCRMQGIDAARFAVAKRDRMTGRALVMSTRTDKRAAEMVGDRDLEAADCLKKAMAAIGNFLEDPEPFDALQHLIKADAWVSQAIKRADARPAASGV